MAVSHEVMNVGLRAKRATPHLPYPAIPLRCSFLGDHQIYREQGTPELGLAGSLTANWSRTREWCLVDVWWTLYSWSISISLNCDRVSVYK